MTQEAGAIIQATSYKVAFYAMGAAFGIALVMIFFWMPETAFIRTGALNLDTGSEDVSVQTALLLAHLLICLQVLKRADLGEKAAPAHLETVEGNPTRTPSSISSQETPNSLYEELLPYSGYVNHVSLINTMFRPFLMLGSPAVLWATLLFTICISWLVGISITLSQIFSAPPYNFSVSAVGLTNLSSFVASLIGTLISGPIIDGLIRKMSMRNGGIFGKPREILYP